MLIPTTERKLGHSPNRLGPGRAEETHREREDQRSEEDRPSPAPVETARVHGVESDLELVICVDLCLLCFILMELVAVVFINGWGLVGVSGGWVIFLRVIGIQEDGRAHCTVYWD